MNVIQSLISDLREKRLWPVAVALLVALIAVPVVLSGGGNSGVPVAQLPPVAAPSTGAVPALPAVSVTATPSNARLTGRQRNPFTQQVKSTSAAKSSASKSSGSASSSKSKSSSGSSKGTSTGSASGSVSGTTTTVTSTPLTTSTPPPPAPTGLTDTQAYHVTISMSSPAGGLYTIDPVQRLTVLPSPQQSLLVELGVLNRGKRVLFVVQPGALVRGPGRCTPGPIDCEIVSLAPNEIEWLGTSGPSGLAGVGLMAVTGISAADYPSSAAADKARANESAAGRALLSKSTFSALSLFEYKPSLGALVDLSNVTVGGN
jgi:hypothetical protein